MFLAEYRKYFIIKHYDQYITFNYTKDAHTQTLNINKKQKKTLLFLMMMMAHQYTHNETGYSLQHTHTPTHSQPDTFVRK